MTTELDLPRHQELVDLACDLRPRISQMNCDMVVIARGLLRAKRLLPYGNFGDWVEEELNIGRRTAERILSVARRFEGKDDTVSHLPATVLYELAAPSTPPELVDDVIAGRVEPKASAIRQARARAKSSGPPSPTRMASRAVSALLQIVEVDDASEWLAEEILRCEEPEYLAATLVTVFTRVHHLLSSDAPQPRPLTGLSQLFANIAALQRPPGS